MVITIGKKDSMQLLLKFEKGYFPELEKPEDAGAIILWGLWRTKKLKVPNENLADFMSKIDIEVVDNGR